MLVVGWSLFNLGPERGQGLGSGQAGAVGDQSQCPGPPHAGSSPHALFNFTKVSGQDIHVGMKTARPVTDLIVVVLYCLSPSCELSLRLFKV